MRYSKDKAMARITRREATLGLAATVGSLASGEALAAPAREQRYDLVIAGGEVVDPSQGLRGRRDIAIRDGRIAAIEPAIPPARARRTLSAAGRIVAPGLIDLHAHVMPAEGTAGPALGARVALHGATTLVAAGDVGAGMIPELRRHIEALRPLRVVAFLDIARQRRPGVIVPEPANVDLDDIDAAAEALADNAGLLIGLKVRLTLSLVERHGVAPLLRAIRACERAGTGARVMCHMASIASADSIGRILDALRPGDILTGCFAATASVAGRRSGIAQDGRLLPAALAAKKRGVILDLGHGGAAFDFTVAEAAIAGGAGPDVLSADMHVLAMGLPGLPSLPSVMSTMLALGIPLDEVIAMATTAPARIVGGAPLLGTLQVGAPADATLLEAAEGAVEFVDTRGNRRQGKARLASAGTVVAGVPQRATYDAAIG